MSAITTGEGEEGCVIVEQTASTGSAKYIVVENGILDNGYRMNFATGIAEFWWLTGDSDLLKGRLLLFPAVLSYKGDTVDVE